MEILQMHGEELFDTIDINLLCRICCKTSVIPLIPIYSGGSDSLASKIILYLPITISEDDIFPTKICIQCANSVIVWHEFFQNSIKADLKIKDILTKRGFQIDIETNNRVGSKLSDGDNSAVPPNLSSEGDEGTEFESEMQVKEELAEIKPSIQEIENIPSEPFSDQLSQDDNDLITDIVKIEPDDMQETQTSQDKSQEFGETSKSHKDIQQHFRRPEIIQNPVNKILMSSSNGRAVLNYFKTHCRLKKNIRNLLSRTLINFEKDRQTGILFRETGVETLSRFKIATNLFVTWAENIEALFPGEHKNVWYTPYRSSSREVIEPDGSVVIKRFKINSSGILLDHYDYARRTLKKQGLVQQGAANSVIPQSLESTDVRY